MTEYVTIQMDVRPQGRIARVTIDNRAKLNSLSTPVIRQLVAAFEGLPGDVRAAILTGAGDKAFIGGASIDEMAALATPADARAFILGVHAACAAVRAAPFPVIAAINGYCLGAGLEVAAACDMRIAAATATFGMPEVRLGLPSVVEAALLPSLIGWGRTRRILMTGETFSAETALAWGLVEDTCPLGDLGVQVDRLLAELLEAQPEAVRIQKALIQRWEELPISGAVAAGVDAFESAFMGDEPARALGAFLERRRAEKAARQRQP